MANLKNTDIASLIKPDQIPRYWESLKPQANVGISVAEDWKKKAEFMDDLSVQNNAVVFLWNSFTNRILYMSDKLEVFTGLPTANFTGEKGMEYVVSRIHPNHLFPVLLMVQNFLVNFSEGNKEANYKSLKICYNYLFKNGIGEYMQVLQPPVILEVDENNKPTLVLNFTYRVDHIKKPDALGAMVIGLKGTYIFDYNQANHSIEPSKTFSVQEMNILQLLGKGLDTKAIADQLFISPHTVDTHRRNIIKKTNCMDTTGAVSFARMTGLI
jgi:DNA-binding CsgD family transcriptional regulator